MSKYFVVVLVCLGLALSSCGDGSHAPPPPDPCIGENIRSFEEDWSDIDYYCVIKTAGHEYMDLYSHLYKVPLIWWQDTYYEDVVVLSHLVCPPSPSECQRRYLYAEWVDAYNADVFLMSIQSNGPGPIPVTGWINICDDVVTLWVEGHEVYYDFEAVWWFTRYIEP